ncbi:MAG: hypothetical protein ACI945_002406, partial [Pseudohongiellaceae bacterium]
VFLCFSLSGVATIEIRKMSIRLVFCLECSEYLNNKNAFVLVKKRF